MTKETVMVIFNQIQAVLLSITVMMMGIPEYAGSREGAAQLQIQGGVQKVQEPTSGTPSSKELQQLVAPIALYPDRLVAQVLAGATYPTQVVEADRWIKENQNLKGDQLAKAVDQQPWDPSIKALTGFPQVLTNMDTNLSWTSALGDAYVNNPKGVMGAIQALRTNARDAGNLHSSPQENVSTEGQTIVIEPADPEVVYVPSYSPDIYGVPIDAYPGYTGWGAVAAGAISFGAGMAVGAASGYGWGYHGWGANWGGGNVTYNRNTFVSNSNTFNNRNLTNVNRNMSNVNRDFSNVNAANINRSQVNAAEANRANAGNVDRNLNRPAGDQMNRSDFANKSDAANRGFGSADRSTMGRSSGAFSGFSGGGAARADSFRGGSSFGGGGGFGGASRGGGGFGGGGGRRR
jgi:hypothetical protein